jgi:hypothetical protein
MSNADGDEGGLPSCPSLNGILRQILGVVVQVLGRILPREAHERVLSMTQ